MGTRPCWPFKTIVFSKAFRDKKNIYIYKDHQHSGCCRHWKSPAAKLSIQLTSHRLWLHPADVQAEKDCHPRTSFCNGMTFQSALPHQSRTSNGGRGVKTICQPSCLSNINSADFFLSIRTEFRAGRPFAGPGQPQDEPVGGCPTISKNESAADVQR